MEAIRGVGSSAQSTSANHSSFEAGGRPHLDLGRYTKWVGYGAAMVVVASVVLTAGIIPAAAAAAGIFLCVMGCRALCREDIRDNDIEDLPELEDIPVEAAKPQEASPSAIRSMRDIFSWPVAWTLKLRKQRKYTILSIDGGGMRGLIPATILDYIEKQTGSRIAKLFDLNAGTSIGSLLAIGLGIPDEKNPLEPKYRASDIVELFDTEATTIFPHSYFRTMRTGGGLWGSIYPRHGINRVTKQLMGKTLFKDLLTETLVPAEEITSGQPWFFNRMAARKNPLYRTLQAVDVGRSSSAAPVYFDPYQITSFKVNGIFPAFADGGISSNNPATDSLFMATRLGYRPEQVYTCSLGTGWTEKAIPYDSVRSWGLNEWGIKLIGLCIDNTSKTVDRQFQVHGQIYPGSYFRSNPQLDKKHMGLDDTSPENRQYLKDRANEDIEERQDEYRELCNTLELNSTGESHHAPMEVYG